MTGHGNFSIIDPAVPRNSLSDQILIDQISQKIISWVHEHTNTSTNKHTGNFPVKFFCDQNSWRNFTPVSLCIPL